MTKLGFIEMYAEKTGLNKKEAGIKVEAFLETLTEVLASGDEVNFTGFGKFSVKTTNERIGRNFKTGEAITIQSKKVAKFKVGKSLADKVAE